MRGAFPILSCEEAKTFEAEYFAGDEGREWAAMQAAGRAVAEGIASDFSEIGPWPAAAQVLVLAGKGHNAGDAFIAAAALRERFPEIRTDVVFALGERGLRPLARRAWSELAPSARIVRPDTAWQPAYDVAIDGVFGFQFRPPLTPDVAQLLARANAWPVRLRAAVDLPSGLEEADAFHADFSYATGIVKAPLLGLENAGRVRFLDLGFPLPTRTAGPCGLGREVLEELRNLRPARSDKRSFGHVLVIAGSRRYPGAALMTTLAALRGGAGLVTAAVPESLTAAFAAQAPEAMWLSLPETPDGGLALEGRHLLREALARATAVVIGPGLGRERETLALAGDVVRESLRPLVIDADALQPEIVGGGAAARVLTPHAGEAARIEAAIPAGAVVVRKGPVTRIETAGREGPVYHSFHGGPVLARGGSGDMLAGLAGAMLARTPANPLMAAARGVVWQGRAAAALARAQGAQAVRTTQLLDFLAPALRDSSA